MSIISLTIVLLGWWQAGPPASQASLDEVCRVHKPDEVIFCAKDIPTVAIIGWMRRIGQRVDFKIAPADGDVFIGSNSKYTQGELYTIDISAARKAKR